MPFTPFHMGPGILVKALLQGSFSLMIFGWTQIVMDIQPLIVLLTGEGHLHGFSHTYLGASLLALLAAVTGKPLSQLGLWMVRITPSPHTAIAWPVVLLSAFIGSFSHVLLDSMMHADIQPYYPANLTNDLLGLVPIDLLHKLCISAGLVGTAVYYTLQWHQKNK